MFYQSAAQAAAGASRKSSRSSAYKRSQSFDPKKKAREGAEPTGYHSDGHSADEGEGDFEPEDGDVNLHGAILTYFVLAISSTVSEAFIFLRSWCIVLD